MTFARKMAAQRVLDLAANRRSAEQQLAAHREARKNAEAVEAELTQLVEHYGTELAAARANVEARVLAHLDDGQLPAEAVRLADANEETNAERFDRVTREQRAAEGQQQRQAVAREQQEARERRT